MVLTQKYIKILAKKTEYQWISPANKIISSKIMLIKSKLKINQFNK